MFDTVLVANRGEIAVRVIRTLRRLGVRSVAVHSDADAGARHVREADVAVRLGPTPAAQSYLSIERLLDAAARTGAQAVHPGYGFLSENTAFAQACADAGLVFVGPPAKAVEVMGDKIRAKQTVSAAGVPVVPGRADPGMTDEDLLAAAEEVGYPVLVKPSAGGGGKGMRLVHRPADLPAALVSARREAATSFGDDTLFLERFVLGPRHVEVQVLADTHGTVLHLGERECSLQRRHQKIVEEAPSPLLTPDQRARYGALAVDVARAVGYTGAGTVEFIVGGDTPDEPFFMEMNTRLQVEHPVTELVTGIDLVEQQLRVAAGEPLPIGQDDVVLTGSAVEARLYAEDPARGFLPTGGTVRALAEPAGEGVRVDSGLLEGLEVGSAYDPMLAKVVAWGPDRDTALTRLDRALAGTVVLGVGTNTGFLRALLADADVRAGRLDTGLVERELDRLTGARVPVEGHAAFALSRLAALRPAGPVVDPWDVPSGWRPGGRRAPLQWDLAGPDGERLTVTLTGGERLRVGDGDEHVVAGTPVDGGLLVTVDGRTTHARTAVDGAVTWVHVDGVTAALAELPPARLHADAASADRTVRSPMPGTVVAVPVTPGATVRAGEPLVVVEAMKMEHTLTAPADGTVDVPVRVGDRVAVDQELAVVHPGEGS
ncbi:acetyl-CoA/propionyl-CoA carboxylase, biotin carboxylase, biotin carboxyl carrier protein [Geodermatophilus tzadiensis]|uniref:Biotin-dependent 3-methylcrotonyl-coenzyme A carboxylase alpha1 subunit n=1 Tax=Geodermatophilus tzadiensis TaxID=1137988 RepID=A0A2T0TWS9_9ACTN|nr:acetyl/propionyl/methylcrotonyl-CoA carboxylase subunit alpha [Geodermatophilus tzadiensis]PRY50113.1 acetyl-CoA/propionyl-CoA carboxylase, biotin carboxylase, biotin carboxyl carrier protein [Geodermatophilus tzadiensis]